MFNSHFKKKWSVNQCTQTDHRLLMKLYQNLSDTDLTTLTPLDSRIGHYSVMQTGPSYMQLVIEKKPDYKGSAIQSLLSFVSLLLFILLLLQLLQTKGH